MAGARVVAAVLVAVLGVAAGQPLPTTTCTTSSFSLTSLNLQNGFTYSLKLSGAGSCTLANLKWVPAPLSPPCLGPGCQCLGEWL